jgi:hypothetical protein
LISVDMGRPPRPTAPTASPSFSRLAIVSRAASALPRAIFGRHALFSGARFAQLSATGAPRRRRRSPRWCCRRGQSQSLGSVAKKSSVRLRGCSASRRTSLDEAGFLRADGHDLGRSWRNFRLSLRSFRPESPARARLGSLSPVSGPRFRSVLCPFGERSSEGITRRRPEARWRRSGRALRLCRRGGARRPHP